MIFKIHIIKKREIFLSPFSNLIYKFPIISWGGLVYKIIDIDHLLYLKIITFLNLLEFEKLSNILLSKITEIPNPIS